MKILALALCTVFITPAILLAQTQSADSCIASKPLIDYLNKGNTYSISINFYVDYASSRAVLELTEEPDGFYATYSKVYKSRFNKSEKKLSKVRMSAQQLSQFRTYECSLQAPIQAHDHSESLTVFTIRVGGKKEEYRDDYGQLKAASEIERILNYHD